MSPNEQQLQRMLDASSDTPPAQDRPEVGSRIEEASSDIRPGTSTGLEKFEQINIGAGEGVVEGLVVPGSAYLGAQLGMGIGTMFAPGIGTGVFGVLGFLGGTAAGMMAADAATKLFPEKPREELAPYREGGKTLGQTMAMAPWAFKIPVERAREVAFFLRNVTPQVQSLPNGLAVGKTGEFVFKTIAAAGETAKKYPRAFMTSEIIAGAGAGVAGGFAEGMAPGDSATRFSAEVLGGLLAPGRNVAAFSGNAVDFLGQIRKVASKSAKQQRVADRLQTILTESAENPSVLLKRLDREDLTNIPLTPAQKTRSMSLSALQTTLARNNVQYGAEMKKQAEDAYRAHSLLLKKLANMDAPQALRFVAEQRQTHFTRMLEERILLAEGESARLASRITADTPQARLDIGEITKRQTQDALTDARTHERMLWDHAYKDAVEITTDAAGRTIVQPKSLKPLQTGEQFMEIVTGMTEARFKSRMPTEVKNIMKGMGIDSAAIARYKQGQLTPEYIETGRVPSQYLTRLVEPESSLIELPRGVQRPTGEPDMVPVLKDVDAQELIKARGDLLSFSREAAGKGDMDNARIYGQLAESLLDDLQQLNSPAYSSARQFSKTLNDTFTRSYAGDIAMGKTRAGAERVPAELLVSRAFSSNADLTLQRMKDIQGAVGMMRTQYDDVVQRFGVDSPQALELQPFADSAAQRVDSILDAQQRGMRLAASKTRGNDGRVNPARLQNFVAENRTLLDQLGITDDLTDAVRAENAFKAIERQNSYIQNTLENQMAFSKVLARENPIQAVGDILKSNYPVKNLQRVTQLAKSGGPDAVEGLKASLYDYAFTQAGGVGNFDVAKYKKVMFEPIGPGQPSIVNMLRSQDMMSREEVRNMLRILRPMENIMAVKDDQRLLGELLDNADAITEFGLRVLGSKVGRFASPTGASSLIAAQAGSSAVRNIFDKQPNMLIRGIMEETSKDPRLMRLMLEKGRTKEQSFSLAQNMHTYLASAGLNFSEFDFEMPEQVDQSPKPPSRYGQSSSDMLFNMLGGRKQPPAPVSRGTPNVKLPTAQGPAQQAQAQQPPGVAAQAPGSESREMLQRLFPNEMN